MQKLTKPPPGLCDPRIASKDLLLAAISAIEQEIELPPPDAVQVITGVKVNLQRAGKFIQ